MRRSPQSAAPRRRAGGTRARDGRRGVLRLHARGTRCSRARPRSAHARQRDEIATLVGRQFDLCGAKTVRDTAKRDCPRFAPADAPPTFCRCITAALDALTDEQIVEDSIAARRNFDERVAALRESRPQPPKYESLMDPIERTCLQK